MNKCKGNLAHYEVVSPTMTSGGYMEPPEPFCCYGLYLARNSGAAKQEAVKDPEFSDWVTEARGDGVPPFKGLAVRLARCEHGNCWACNADENTSGCPICDAEYREAFA